MKNKKLSSNELELQYDQNGNSIRGNIADFKKGDVLRYQSAHNPNMPIRVIQLETDKFDYDNPMGGITDDSDADLWTSHLISPEWYLVKIKK